MKNLKRTLAAIVVLAAFATTSNAQSTASATATATIVTPILITKNFDMNFGNIAVRATPGTVVLDTAGARTATGGVTLPTTVGTVSAARFTVTGSPDYTYAVTLPATPFNLTHTNTTSVMPLSAITTTVGRNLGAGGSQALNLGATLGVGANQLAGVYTSAAFDVTVNYN
jgi:hypothetical protein